MRCARRDAIVCHFFVRCARCGASLRVQAREFQPKLGVSKGARQAITDVHDIRCVANLKNLSLDCNKGLTTYAEIGNKFYAGLKALANSEHKKIDECPPEFKVRKSVTKTVPKATTVAESSCRTVAAKPDLANMKGFMTSKGCILGASCTEIETKRELVVLDVLADVVKFRTPNAQKCALTLKHTEVLDKVVFVSAAGKKVLYILHHVYNKNICT